jgi:hypothetical protein
LSSRYAIVLLFAVLLDDDVVDDVVGNALLGKGERNTESSPSPLREWECDDLSVGKTGWGGGGRPRNVDDEVFNVFECIGVSGGGGEEPLLPT